MKKVFLIIFKLIGIIIIQLIAVLILLKEDLLKTINLDYETNDFCQTITNNSDNNLDYYACDNKFKKEKIILLLVDSLPFDILHDLHNLKEYRLTNFFKGEGIEYKQSGALFETIFTGKFSRNYLASNEMKMDNLQQQFYNSKMDVFYKVKDFPLYGLFNKKIIKKNRIELYEGEDLPLIFFCDIDINPFLSFEDNLFKNYYDDSELNFKEGLDQNYLYEKADEKLEKEFKKLRKQFNSCLLSKGFNSYVFFTDSLDHINHVSHRNSPITIFSVYFVEKLVKELINWINEEHGEYALALASDHGGQLYYGEDALCNHGCNSLGNEAVFFVYTKDLGDNYEKYKANFEKGEIPNISLNDYVCTISQVLKNTNLPLESTCTPRNIGNDKLIFFSSIKSKEIQLKEYVEKLVKKYPSFKDNYKKKYDKKLKDNKFISYFKDLNSIYQAEEKLYDDYMKYLIDIQNELLSDVVKFGQNIIYFLTFYLILFSIIFGFFYFVRKLILLTREKVYKKIKKKENNLNPFLSKLVHYTYILIYILLIDPIICIIKNNTLNISYYINLSIWIKFFSILILVICISFLNNIKSNNYIKLIITISFIIILHLIASKIELFSSLDKYINTQKKTDFIKIYLSYPFILIYGFTEIYSNRNYYIFPFKKYNIRYIYILLPYLFILTCYIFSFDFHLKIKNVNGHSPETIHLLNKIYIMIFLLLLFIKPFYIKKSDKIDNDGKSQNNYKIISSDIINTKLFLFIMIIFICTELERIEMILLFNFILFYLCYCFKNEQDIFVKMIYLTIIIIYPQIHFIGNQGTYTLDTSIKATFKCPSKWADDRPIFMGVIFFFDKLRFNIMDLGYLFSLIKISKTKMMSYYTELIRLFHSIQLFGILICFLYYIKMERESSFIQILYLMETQMMPVILFDLVYLLNYFIYKIIHFFVFGNSFTYYEAIDKIDINTEEYKI